MTREEATKLWPIIKAFSEGKTVQFKCYNEPNGWVESGEHLHHDWFKPNLVRIKPEPTYRPWKPEEAIIGAVIQFDNFRTQILAVRNEAYKDFPNCIVFIGDNQVLQYYPLVSLASKKYTLDNGTTWYPCGVLES